MKIAAILVNEYFALQIKSLRFLLYLLPLEAFRSSLFFFFVVLSFAKFATFVIFAILATMSLLLFLYLRLAEGLPSTL